MSNYDGCDSSGVGEGEADDELVVEGRRSTRRSSARQTSSSKQKQRQALESLRQARTEGRVHRPRVSDMTNEVYEEMTEQEYQERKARQREFVERDGSGYCVSSEDEDDADDDAYDDDLGSRSNQRNGKRRGGRHADKSLKRARPSGPTITSLFRSSTNKKSVESEEAITLEDDDYLKECLAGITGVAATASTPSSMIPDSDWDAPHEQPTPAKTFESFPKPRPPIPTRQLDESLGERAVGVVNEQRRAREQIGVRNERDSCGTPKAHSDDGGRPSAPAVEKPVLEGRKVQEEQTLPETTAPHSIFDDTGDVNDDFGQHQPQHHTTQESMEELRPAETVMDVGGSGAALRFYWIDAFEDPVKHPGTVYVFGRVRVDTFYGPVTKSCCLVVRSVRRRVYFIKRDLNRRDASEVTLRDVQVEVEHRLRDAKVAKFKSAPADPQLRYLIRDKRQRLGEREELLEVHMEASAAGEKCPRSDWEGNTYASVLNTTTTAMERLLTECGIKGPCWLDVAGAVKVAAEQRISHCPEAEYTIDAEQPAEVIRVVIGEQSQAPPLPVPVTMAALTILTAVNEKDNERQIVMVSMLFNDAFPLDKATRLDARKMKRFCLLTKLQNGVSLPFNLDDLLKQRGMSGEMVRRMPDERSLLNCLLAKMANINPDLLVAHDLTAHLQLLRDRISKYNLANWHQLGRLRRSVPLRSIHHAIKQSQWELTAGRVCLDAKVAASELVHARSYEQADLIEQILKPVDGALTRTNLSAEAIASPFNSSTPQIGLIELMEWSWKEVFLTLRIVNQLNAVPLFLQITQIVGGVLSRTMMGGRADRNDYLLLHACYKNKYIAPDKHSRHAKNAPKGSAKAKTAKNKHVEESGDGGEDEAMEQDVGEEDGGEDADPQSSVPVTAARKKAGGPQYSGGLVLEPKKGLYHTCIILLDFNSLYPSIIQEYNICFTTVSSAFADVDESDLPPMPESGKPEGILKKEIRELVNRRREVKALMQKAKPGSELHTQYHIRQMGLKLTANSMYGCLGFEGSRFFAKTLAAMITARGREILMHAKQLVEAEGHSVIYGDTDSLMINTNKDDVAEAKAIGMRLKQSVNKNYRLLELDIDGIYKRLLLLKKKKYAALTVADINGGGEVLKKEMKGLDIVRRDWSEVAKEVGEEVVELILRSTDRDRLAESVTSSLREFRDKLNAGQIPIEKFAILKQLHKNPEEEGKRNKNQPHILVALRLNATNKFRFRPGDIVPYIICNDGSSNSHTQRAYHPSELVAEPDRLSLDVDYYLNSQVLPVVSRLCEPIDELGAGRIAGALGLDSRRYGGAKRTNRHESAQSGGAQESELANCLEEDFSACEGFQLQCECGQPVTVRRPIEGEGYAVSYVLEKCQKCSRDFHSQLGSVLKQLVLAIKAKVQANLSSPYKCEDVACEAQIGVPHPDQFTHEGVLCYQCGSGFMRKDYSDGHLFHQLCFFKAIFDVQSLMRSDPNLESQLKRRPDAAETRQMLDKCLAVVERFLKQNDFNRVDLSTVFGPLFVNRKRGGSAVPGGVLKGA